MSTEKRKKKRPRGRPPEQEVPFLPATFKEILQRVVQTRTPEEIQEIIDEEKRKHDGDDKRRRADGEHETA